MRWYILHGSRLRLVLKSKDILKRMIAQINPGVAVLAVSQMVKYVL